MPWWIVLIIIFSTFCFFAAVHLAGKSKRPFKRALFSMIIGILTLAAIDLSSGITNVYIPVSLLSVLVSLIGGVPGVTLLLGLNLFF